MHTNIRIGVLLLCFMVGSLFPLVSQAEECTCTIEYSHYQGCSDTNVNAPFTKDIVFSGSNGGKSLFTLLREYLSYGYPEVCDEPSNIITNTFVAELESAVDQTCHSGAPLRRDDFCYVWVGNDRNNPQFAIRETAPGSDLPQERCVKSVGGG